MYNLISLGKLITQNTVKYIGVMMLLSGTVITYSQDALLGLYQQTVNMVHENRAIDCLIQRSEDNKGWVDNKRQVIWETFDDKENDKPVKRPGLTQSLEESPLLKAIHGCWYMHEVETFYANLFIKKQFNITIESWGSDFASYELRKDNKAWRLTVQRQSRIEKIKKGKVEEEITISEIRVHISPYAQQSVESIPQRTGAFPIVVYQAEQEAVYKAVLAIINELPDGLPKIPTYQHLEESEGWKIEVSDPISGYIRIAAISKFKSCKGDDTCENEVKHTMVINVTGIGNGFTKVGVSQYVKGQEAVDWIMGKLRKIFIVQ